MKQEYMEQLYTQYGYSLLESSIPFWMKHSLDLKNGGYFTCLDREGKVYNTDKSIWFQGRGLWIYSKLYNEVKRRQEWLEAAKLGYDFLTRYGFDKDGRMFFQVTDDGRPLQKRRYIFSEMFAIMGLVEYYKACGDRTVLVKAIDTNNIVLDIYKNPSKIAPKTIPETRAVKSHSLYMMMLCTTNAMREVDSNPVYDEIIDSVINILFKDFVKPEKKALFETVGMNGELLDNPIGRCINPGHAIETSWFLMHEGIHRNDTNLIGKAMQILDWSLELGWDKEYGGILYFIDIEGKPTEQLEWDMKLWWPHCEALYATLLAYSLTGDTRYEEWHTKIHEWSFNHFEDRMYGDWYGYLHRDGSVSNTLKGSMWKGPYHLPRALLLCYKLLEKMRLHK